MAIRIMKAKRLAAQRLEKTFNARKVVDGLSIHVDSGEIVGLLGPNGAGKTTTFYMVVGLLKPDKGTVFLDENELTKLSLSARARAGISYLPQERSLFQGLTVGQNLLAVLEFQDITRQEQIKRRDELIVQFNLDHVASNLASSLSGGEARRLEIARALAIQPMFMLLDEPFAGIDPITVTSIQDIIKRLRAQGIGILISDHNVRETLRICDRAYILNQGKLLEAGDPERLSQSPLVRAVYLGDNFRL